jgi:long-chain fatty acid transport protein
MKFNKLAIALAVAGFSTSALATNGDNLIGLGAQSRALGGASTAAFFGSENALSNPALIGKIQGTEFALGATAFMPDVNASTDVTTVPASAKSKGDMYAIPEVSMASRINANWSWGLGMYGTSGMGVDYRGGNGDWSNPQHDGLFNAYSNLQMMKFAPTVAYNGGNFGIGIAPVAQYGSLDINYIMPDTGSGAQNVGYGSKQSDFGYGVNLGGYFDVSKDLTLGATYQSKIKMEYGNVITTAADGFGIGPNGFAPTILSDRLDQPAEIKLGVAYTMGPWMVTGDYKRVYWSDAAGYKEFNWKDQDVFAIGGKYSGSGWWVGVGYNHAKDPIDKLADTSYPNQAINTFNNMFFPAIVEDHYTLGGGIALNKNTSLDLAYVHAAKVSKTINTGFVSQTSNPAATTETTTHSQDAVTVSVRMNF